MKGKVVVVSGASAGVGRAAARAFGKQGAHVGLIARGRDGLEGARREIEREGGKALVAPADVAEAEQVEAAAEKVEKAFGPIDVWVNVAMTTIFAPVVEVKPDEFKRATEVSYLGTVYGTMAAVKRMIPRNQGTIVQVGSAMAYRGIPLQSAYCGAKYAIRGFTDSLRTELIHYNSKVHITMVQLPGLNTTQFSWCRSRLPKNPRPVAPIYQPEVAAEAIVWSARHRRRELYVGIPSAAIIRLNKVFPSLLDLYLAASGWKGQMTDRPIRVEEQDNLFVPVPGDHGARGAFDDEAHEHSVQLWAAFNRNWILLGCAGIGAALGGWLISRKCQ